MAGVRIFEIGCVLAWVCAALGLPACVTDSNTNWLTELKPDDGVYRASALTQKRPFAEYAATELSYTPSIETYGLPLRLSDVENLDRDIRGQSDLFDWTADEEALLAQNGLVAVAGQPEMTRFEHAYAELKDRDLPILVTADSALHLVHLAFQQVLKNLEVQELAPRLGALLPELARSLGALYKALDGDLKEAARRDLAWVSVAASLLDPLGFQAVPEVADEVEKALQYIRTAGEELEGGRAASPVFSRDCSSPDACAEKDSPLEDDPEGAACRCEDYTQYQPRGHYTETEELSRYFRCFTYLSRMSMRIESPMETTMAALLTAALNKTTVDFRGAEAPAVSMWDGIYRATSFFVGAAEDLTFIEYDRLLGQVYGEAFSIRELADEAKLGQLRTMLREAREAQVATGFGEAALQADETSAGLRFFGRHFPFDAYSLAQMAFQHLGPNPQDPNYNYVIENLDPDCVSEAGQEQGAGDLAQCEGQDSADWQSICCSAARLAAIEERPELTEICRFLPSGLDLAGLPDVAGRALLPPDPDPPPDLPPGPASTRLRNSSTVARRSATSRRIR